jgi:hypothetical protein
VEINRDKRVDINNKKQLGLTIGFTGQPERSAGWPVSLNHWAALPSINPFHQ